MGIYTKVHKSKVPPGTKLITTKWVDTNKGDDVNPMCRSRLVLRDMKARKTKNEQLEAKDLFSSMPPLESFRTMVSLMMSKRVSSRGLPLKLAFYDISRAHFMASWTGRCLQRCRRS